MDRKLSLKSFIHETAYLAPELFDDAEFMDEWCQKYFGIKFDQELTPKDPE